MTSNHRVRWLTALADALDARGGGWQAEVDNLRGAADAIERLERELGELRPAVHANKVQAEEILRLREALEGFAELQPRPEEYINASEWRKATMDAFSGVAKIAREALRGSDTSDEPTLSERMTDAIRRDHAAEGQAMIERAQAECDHLYVARAGAPIGEAWCMKCGAFQIGHARNDNHRSKEQTSYQP
jgi:hypothetical protein